MKRFDGFHELLLALFSSSLPFSFPILYISFSPYWLYWQSLLASTNVAREMFSTISYLDISLVKSHLSNRWGTRRRPGCLTRIVSLPLVRFSLPILPTRLVMELGLTGNLRPLSGLSEFLYLSHIHVFCSANELSLLYSFHSTWLDHLKSLALRIQVSDFNWPVLLLL